MQHTDVVHAPCGPVRGFWREGSAAFLGIPFAEAPVGDLRFAAPRPRRPWTEVLDATAYGATPQRRPFAEVTTIPEPSVPGEDILSVNVFTPRPGDVDAQLPVLVWIHGGGYMAGSPASPWYDGAAFNRDGVVTLTVSYRLGFQGFGWIEDAPGNRGVLDWVAALQWVRDNIASFGGDPDRVTIAGQSAGGGAVLTLMRCPRARGLFSAVVAHSGVPRLQSLEAARASGTALAELADVSPTLAGWAEVDEATLLDQEAKHRAADGGESGVEQVLDSIDPAVPSDMLSFAPYVDGDVLPEGEPYVDVPLLIGATAHEFTAMGSWAVTQLGEVAPLDALRRRFGTEVTDALVAAHPELSPELVLGQLMTMKVFRLPILDVLADRGDAPTWLYDFREVGTSGQSEHCLELPFVFGCLDEPGAVRVLGADADQGLADRMHADWVDFVSGHAVDWPPVAGTPTGRTYRASGVVDGPVYRLEHDLFG